jgi:NADH-quinone oxidoreductase subunit M
MLWMFQRVNYGTITNAKNRGLRDLSVREWCVIAPVCAIAIFMGVVPGIFLKPMEPAVKRVVEHIRGGSAPVNVENRAPDTGVVPVSVPAPAVYVPVAQRPAADQKEPRR